MSRASTLAKAVGSNGDIAVSGSTTLGDAVGDILTINAGTVSTPNGLNIDSNSLVIDHTNNRIGIGVTAPSAKLEVSSDTGSLTPVPTEIRISTTTAGSNWSTTLPWGRLGYYSADASTFGPKLIATIDVIPNSTSGGNASLTFNSADSSAGALTERMRITNGGDVGIGTISPTTKIQITRNALSGFVSRTQAAITLEDTAGTELYFASNTTGYGQLRFGDTDSNFRGAFTYDHSVDAMYFVTAGSERMRINSSGNVGIGTTSPSNLFHLRGDGNATQHIRIANSQTSYNTDLALFTHVSGNFSIGLTNSATPLTSQTMTFLVNNSSSGQITAMKLDSSGNLGVGTTSPSTFGKVAVYGSGTAPVIGAFLGSNSPTTGATLADISFGARTDGAVTAIIRAIANDNGNGTDGQLTFYTADNTASTAASEKMRIDSSGNLGIGTATPSYRLDVSLSAATAGTADTARFYADASSSAEARILFGTYANPTNAAIGAQTESATAGILKFYTETAGTLTEHMRIHSSGNVGIGTTTLTNKLNVAGAIQSSSILTAVAASTVALSQEAGYSRLAAFGPNASTGGALYLYSISSNGSVQNGAAIDASGNWRVGSLAITQGNADAKSTIYGGATDSSPCLELFKGSATSNPNQVFMRFQISQSATAVASGSIASNGGAAAAFAAWSDRRLKENIVNLPSQLDKIMALRPVEFDYIGMANGHQIGFIAQEVQEIYPDLVGENADGMLTLTDMNKNDARLIKCIQEQQVIIQSLKARLDAANL